MSVSFTSEGGEDVSAGSELGASSWARQVTVNIIVAIKAAKGNHRKSTCRNSLMIALAALGVCIASSNQNALGHYDRVSRLQQDILVFFLTANYRIVIERKAELLLSLIA
jgi:hypothetical protein